IIDNQSRSSCITEIFSDGGSSKGCVELHRRGGRSTGCYDHGIVHRSVAAQCCFYLLNGRSFLTTGYVDTIYRLAPIVEFFLIDNGIDGNSCLTGLSVTDNQLPLPTPDRTHRVDRFSPSL